MAFNYKEKIPEPAEIIEMMPLPSHLEKAKDTRDSEIKDVFSSNCEKFILIIGPCSADNEDAVFEYCSRLADLQEKVKEKIILIPRIYTNKPRTTGKGYKGLLHQPDPHKTPCLTEGIKAIRRLHLKIISETGLSTSDEMLYPNNHPYLEDLLSYVAIGARSVENQQHRLTASGLDMPVGMKNPTSGDLSVMLNSIYAAQQSHAFIYNGREVQTTGNPYAHAIMRGAVDLTGRNLPNYHFEDLKNLADVYTEKSLKNPAIIVDTNHANSNKKYKEQIRIGLEVLHSRNYSKSLKKIIKGLMIESYLVEGAQSIDDNIYGKSITDPCLGWNDTSRFVMQIADRL